MNESAQPSDAPDSPLARTDAPATDAPASAEEAAAADEAQQVNIGGALFALGALSFPLGIGAVIGFWGADSGVLWLSMAGTLLILWIVGLVIMIAGSYVMGPAMGKPRGRKRIVMLSLLVVLVSGAYMGVGIMNTETPLTTLGENFSVTWAQDARHYRELDRGIEGVLDHLSGMKAFVLVAGEPAPLSAEEEKEILDAWMTFMHSAFTLDRTRRFYEDYKYFDTSRLERDWHIRSYLLTFASELALYERTAQLVALLDRNPNVAKFLDLPRPDRGLPRGSVGFVREELAGLTDLARVIAGKKYLQWLATVHSARRQAVANGYGWLWTRVEQHLRSIEARSTGELSTLTVSNDFQPIKRKLKEIVYPVQSDVATWIADVRVKRQGRYLITSKHLEGLHGVVMPGDIMLGRKNWYLSNVGLPGFWPHAFLYVGSEEELAAAFDDDPETRAWVKRTCGKDWSYTQFLARTYPDAWRDRARAPGEHPLLIIEAISEGVLQNPLGHASGDYLATLRPKLPLWVKARALSRAFGYLGRQYDFDFDFATDHKLVCSEVVWRSYRPLKDEGDPGLRISTKLVAGRQTLPPTEFARIFRDEKPAEAQFEFVYFLEGIEKTQTAVVADEAAFRASVDRSKWDVAQR